MRMDWVQILWHAEGHDPELYVSDFFFTLKTELGLKTFMCLTVIKSWLFRFLCHWKDLGGILKQFAFPASLCFSVCLTRYSKNSVSARLRTSPILYVVQRKMKTLYRDRLRVFWTVHFSYFCLRRISLKDNSVPAKTQNFHF